MSLAHGGSVYGRSWVEAVTELSPATESWTEHPGGAGEGRKQVASALRKHRGHRRSLTTLQTEFCGPWGEAVWNREF